MSGINKVILVGNVGADPEVKSFQSGRSVGNLRIATSKKIKRNDEWEQVTQWHNIVVWDQNKIKLLEYVKKGTRLYVEGELETRKWQDQNGTDRYTTEVIVNPFGGNMQIVSDGKGKGSGQKQERQERQDDGGYSQQSGSTYDDLDDDIPF